MKPYRPSNGTEGSGFIEIWCMRCIHDRAVRLREDYDNGCQILARTFFLKITDPNYPKEWVKDDDGNNARCTAFIEDTHDDDWEPPPPPDPRQIVLIADPTEDIAGLTPALPELVGAGA